MLPLEQLKPKKKKNDMRVIFILNGSLACFLLRFSRPTPILSILPRPESLTSAPIPFPPLPPFRWTWQQHPGRSCRRSLAYRGQASSGSSWEPAWRWSCCQYKEGIWNNEHFFITTNYPNWHIASIYTPVSYYTVKGLSCHYGFNWWSIDPKANSILS